MAHIPYNPLDRTSLGASVSEALLRRDPVPLRPMAQFVGAGIYAIYYTGDYEPYSPIAERNRDAEWCAPIYVGKAVPAGARQGGYGLGESPGTAMYSRLRQHADSIDAARNLDLADFHCRYLVVEDIWIPLGESLLIRTFQPIWNTILDGFGNHDPGSGRYNQQRSPWDVLHPGRSWAERLQPSARSESAILAALGGYFSLADSATSEPPEGPA